MNHETLVILPKIHSRQIYKSFSLAPNGGNSYRRLPNYSPLLIDAPGVSIKFFPSIRSWALIRSEKIFFKNVIFPINYWAIEDFHYFIILIAEKNDFERADFDKKLLFTRIININRLCLNHLYYVRTLNILVMLNVYTAYCYSQCDIFN